MDPVHVRLSYFIITLNIILSSTQSLQYGLISSGCTEEIFYEICPLVEFSTAQNSGFSPTFRDKLSVPSSGVKKFFLDSFTLEDGTTTLSQNVCKELIFYAAQNLPPEVQIS